MLAKSTRSKVAWVAVLITQSLTTFFWQQSVLISYFLWLAPPASNLNWKLILKESRSDAKWYSLPKKTSQLFLDSWVQVYFCCVAARFCPRCLAPFTHFLLLVWRQTYPTQNQARQGAKSAPSGWGQIKLVMFPGAGSLFGLTTWFRTTYTQSTMSARVLALAFCGSLKRSPFLQDFPRKPINHAAKEMF